MNETRKDVIEREALTCLHFALKELGIQNILLNSCTTLKPGEDTNIEYESKMACFKSNMIDMFWVEYKKSNDMLKSIITIVDFIANEYRIKPALFVNRAMNQATKTHEIICSYARREDQVLSV